MSWTYSRDPADSPLDEVRFLVGDTDSSDQLISDEEIEYLIAKWTPVYGSNLMVAAMAAEAISAKFAREVAYSADGVSVGVQELQQKFDALASSLRDQYKQFDIGGGPDVGGVLWAEYPDPTVRPTIFSIGQHDNPKAGEQDSGENQTYTIPEIEGSW